MWWIICISYLAIGAAIGLIFEELHHRNSSDGYREPREYVFAAFGFAIFWPVVLFDVGSAT